MEMVQWFCPRCGMVKAFGDGATEGGNPQPYCSHGTGTPQPFPMRKLMPYVVVTRRTKRISRRSQRMSVKVAVHFEAGPDEIIGAEHAGVVVWRD